MKYISKSLIAAYLILTYSNIFAQSNNIGGILHISNIQTWQRESLTFNTSPLFNAPIETTIKPKNENIFLIVSAQLKVDWSDFPNATQYLLDTREVYIKSERQDYKPIGTYQKGGGFSDFLSSHLYISKEKDIPYFYDLVFIVSKEDRCFTFCTSETKTDLELQKVSREQKEIPAIFEIAHVEVLGNNLSSPIALNGLFSRKASNDLIFENRLLTGNYLKMSLNIIAKDNYALNHEGIYCNNNLTIYTHKISIKIPDKRYFPAIGAFLNDKISNSLILTPEYSVANNAKCTILFCVPKEISTFDLLYSNKPVIEGYSLERKINE